MKKLLILAASIALYACGGADQNYTVTGVATSLKDGSEVILKDAGKGVNLDTAIIAEGKFSFSGEAATPFPAGVTVKSAKKSINLIVEPGNITVNFDDSSVSGTPLNVALQERSAVFTAEYENYNAKNAELKEKFGDDKEAISKAMSEYYKTTYLPNTKAITAKVFEANKTNILGAMVFLETGDVDVAKLDEFMAANPYAKDYAPIVKERNVLQSRENTAVGKMFTDFDARDIENSKDVKFSDYVGQGKYVLVDFWASWCGPCKAEMTYIKKVYEKFGKKNLVVLGVNVWDKHEPALKTIKDFDMKWSHIYASDNKVATDTYGVKGIPTLILFAPDGTIVNRTFRGQEMVDTISELLK